MKGWRFASVGLGTKKVRTLTLFILVDAMRYQTEAAFDENLRVPDLKTFKKSDCTKNIEATVCKFDVNASECETKSGLG